ncbi:hypothetical protein [Streptomyces uncialis]|uniref:hypothetical protein n=1 Tax=Streptomyces uncialis TaxID=1048205 RepID=UPI0033C61927
MKHRVVPFAVASSLTVGVLLAAAAPASAGPAAVPCTAAGANVKTFQGVGVNQVDVELCGWRTVVEDLVQGFADVDWRLDASTITFASFRIETRIEKRSGVTGPDTVVTTGTCDMTAAINATATPPVVPERCHTVDLVSYDPSFWWSTDATVTYDIAGDGIGPSTWQLNGSPLVRTS